MFGGTHFLTLFYSLKVAMAKCQNPPGFGALRSERSIGVAV